MKCIVSFDKKMLEMKHLNINEFYGICLDVPVVCIVSKFAPKGSLWDLIRFKDFSLPVDFKMSFAIDVASVSILILRNHPFTDSFANIFGS